MPVRSVDCSTGSLLHRAMLGQDYLSTVAQLGLDSARAACDGCVALRRARPLQLRGALSTHAPAGDRRLQPCIPSFPVTDFTREIDVREI